METQSNKGFKIGWDRLQNRVVHIDQVKEGFENAICPDCDSPLIAANYNPDARKNTTYFRHQKDCTGNGETLIHRWAKQVIEDKRCLLGAKYVSEGKSKDLMRKIHHVEMIHAAQRFELRSCHLEKAISFENEDRVPDVSAVLHTGEPLYVEVFVSNAVDENRSQFYKSHSLSCIEIDLSALPGDYLNEPQKFENYVTDIAPRKWVNCTLYPDLDANAQIEAVSKAKISSAETSARRKKNRTAKIKWRGEHNEFLGIVEAYLQQENQEKAAKYYEGQLKLPGTQSYNTAQLLKSEFRTLPEIVNIPVKGELGFHCHRIVWQWEIYSRLVIDDYSSFSKTVNVRTTRFTRGYEKEMTALAWYDYVPQYSAETLYTELLCAGVTIRPICQKAEELVGESIVGERDRPKELQYMKVNEWSDMPKPVCVIRRYLNELVNRGLLETTDNYYLVKYGAMPPIYKKRIGQNIERGHVNRARQYSNQDHARLDTCPACKGSSVIGAPNSWICADCGATKEEPYRR